MEFKEFSELFKKHFAEMTKNRELFEVEVDKDKLWNLYLDSFPEGANPIFRKRREFDCSCCRGFIRAVGNAVVIKNNYEIETVWDFNVDGTIYEPVVKALSAFIKEHQVTNVYLMSDNRRKLGAEKTIEYDEENKTSIVWNHFNVELPRECVRKGSEIDTIKSDFRATKNVFKRSLEEISLESVETVLELIQQKSLYRGEEWESTLRKFLSLKNEYRTVNDSLKDNFYWINSIAVGPVIGRIKNHSIGTLLMDITKSLCAFGRYFY